MPLTLFTFQLEIVILKHFPVNELMNETDPHALLHRVSHQHTLFKNPSVSSQSDNTQWLNIHLFVLIKLHTL